MKIGDKVRILIGIRTGQTGTIKLINDNHMDDYLVKVEDGDAWYGESELEPISGHMTADELAITPTEKNALDKLLSNISTMSEDEERLLKNARATFDDEELRFGVSKDYKTYQDGLKEGYKKGFNAGVKQTRDKVVDALFTVVKI